MPDPTKDVSSLGMHRTRNLFPCPHLLRHEDTGRVTEPTTIKNVANHVRSVLNHPYMCHPPLRLICAPMGSFTHITHEITEVIISGSRMTSARTFFQIIEVRSTTSAQHSRQLTRQVGSPGSKPMITLPFLDMARTAHYTTKL